MELQHIIATVANAGNVNEECQQLVDTARERTAANDRLIAQEIFAEWIDELPAVWSGTYHVAYKDDFGQWTQKEQAWNDALWLVSINMVAAFGATNSNRIAGALMEWSKKPANCMVQLDEQAATQMAEYYIVAMQNHGWLELTPVSLPEEIDGRVHTVSVFNTTLVFKQVRELNAKTLVDRATMVCQPLKFKPQPWTSNYDGIAETANLKLIKGYSQSIVPKHVLDAANAAQSVAFEVHPEIQALASLVVDNEQDFRNCLGYSNPKKAAKWAGVLEQWKVIAQMQLDTPYYFPVTYDFRGRMYYRGGMVSPQASDCCKAAFAFRKGYPLGQHGFHALCIALANAMGSKEAVSVRIKQIETYIDGFTAYMGDFRKFCNRFPDADHCQAWVLLKEIFNALEHKKVHGSFDEFPSNVVCHQDGTCSGLQHISVITKDLPTAQSVNMAGGTFEQKPADVYGLVAAASEHDFVIDKGRDFAKTPVMTAGYGASRRTIISRLIDKLKQGEVWNDSYMDALELGMGKAAPALHKYTNAIQSRAKEALGKGAVEFNWKAYDGFPVCQQYVDNSANVFRGEDYSAMMRRHDVKLDVQKMETALSPNTIHTQDGCHLRLTTTTSRMDIALIHDSFGSHACNWFSMNKVLRTTMHEMYKEHDMLHDLTSRNEMRPVTFIDNGHDINMILESKNAFS